MNCVDFPKTLCLPVLASFADSKLVDFALARFYESRAIYGMYVY